MSFVDLFHTSFLVLLPANMKNPRAVPLSLRKVLGSWALLIRLFPAFPHSFYTRYRTRNRGLGNANGIDFQRSRRAREDFKACLQVALRLCQPFSSARHSGWELGFFPKVEYLPYI